MGMPKMHLTQVNTGCSAILTFTDRHDFDAETLALGTPPTSVSFTGRRP